MFLQVFSSRPEWRCVCVCVCACLQVRAFKYLNVYYLHPLMTWLYRSIFTNRTFGACGASKDICLLTDVLEALPRGAPPLLQETRLHGILLRFFATEELTYTLKIDPWKRRFLLETIIFRGYVSFREGTIWYFLTLHPLEHGPWMKMYFQIIGICHIPFTTVDGSEIR